MAVLAFLLSVLVSLLVVSLIEGKLERNARSAELNALNQMAKDDAAAKRNRKKTANRHRMAAKVRREDVSQLRAKWDGR